MEENIYRMLEVGNEIIDLKHVYRVKKWSDGGLTLRMSKDFEVSVPADMAEAVQEQYRMFLKTSPI